MVDKKKRQSKCTSDDQKNTKGGVNNLAVQNLQLPIAKNLKGIQDRHTKGSHSSTIGSKSSSSRHTTSATMQQSMQQSRGGPFVVKPVTPISRPSAANNSTRRHSFSNTQQTLQNGLNQLQEYFHGLILERMLVCNNTCNKDGVEILSTSDGQQPPGGGKNVVVLDYECFEDEPNGKPKKNICCTPPIKSNCKNLIYLIKELLKEILTKFFESASSPEIFKFDISKVAKACVVSYFIETITTQLIDNKPNSNISNSSNNNEVVKFYIKVSVQAITGDKVNTARDFLVHVNVNSLKLLLEVPNINVLTSKIINNELKTQIPEIIKEIKNVNTMACIHVNMFACEHVFVKNFFILSRARLRFGSPSWPDASHAQWKTGTPFRIAT